MNAQQQGGVINLGKKPSIKILQELDKDDFEKKFHELLVMGWIPSPIGHQMFYDEEQKKIVTCFICIFTQNL